LILIYPGPKKIIVFHPSMPKESHLNLEKNIILNHAYNTYLDLIIPKEEDISIYQFGSLSFKNSIFNQMESLFLINKEYHYLHTTKLFINISNPLVQKHFFNFYDNLVLPELSQYGCGIKMESDNFATLRHGKFILGVEFKNKDNTLSFYNSEKKINSENFFSILNKNKLKKYSQFEENIENHYGIVSSAMDCLIDLYQSPESKLTINLDPRNLDIYQEGVGILPIIG